MLNSLHAGYFFVLLESTFFKIHFFQKFLSGTLSVSNGLDPDQDPHFVRPDLGPNSLQRLSADNKIIASKERLNLTTNIWFSTHSREFRVIYKPIVHALLIIMVKGF